MRDLINLFEDQQWPATISGDDLALHVQELHHTPEDFIDGDIENNIASFGVYNLRTIPITDIRRGMYTIYDDLVGEYAAVTTQAPPVIVDPSHGLVIDGNHRVEAAVARGETEILAYVGDPETYSYISNDEDEDEDDEYRPKGW
jgi:hypothetical protein